MSKIKLEHYIRTDNEGNMTIKLPGDLTIDPNGIIDMSKATTPIRTPVGTLNGYTLSANGDDTATYKVVADTIVANYINSNQPAVKAVRFGVDVSGGPVTIDATGLTTNEDYFDVGVFNGDASENNITLDFTPQTWQGGPDTTLIIDENISSMRVIYSTTAGTWGFG